MVSRSPSIGNSTPRYYRLGPPRSVPVVHCLHHIANMLNETNIRQRNVLKKSESDVSSDSSTPPSSILHSSSETNLSDADKKQEHIPKKPLSLKERARVPYSFYVSVSSTILLQYCSGMWNISSLHSLLRSYKESARTAGNLVMQACSSLSNPTNTKQFTQTLMALACVLSLLYVFIIAPARAGLWTMPKARKHKTHRYMGLIFMVQYALAWVEFLTNYGGKDGTAAMSYIPHAVALNGTSQIQLC